MAGLLDLCHEILHAIVVEVDPQDIAALSKCCSTLHKFISSNRLLFREQFLKNFVREGPFNGFTYLLTNTWKDDPRITTSCEEPDFESKLPQLVHLEKILQSTSEEVKVCVLSLQGLM